MAGSLHVLLVGAVTDCGEVPLDVLGPRSAAAFPLVGARLRPPERPGGAPGAPRRLPRLVASVARCRAAEPAAGPACSRPPPPVTAPWGLRREKLRQRGGAGPGRRLAWPHPVG